MKPLYKEFSWQDLCRRPGGPPGQDLYKEFSWQDLMMRSLGKTSWTRSFYEISWQDAKKNFVHVACAWSDMRKTMSAVCTLGRENAFLPMLRARHVFACSLPRFKQLCAGISYSVSWFVRETIARKTL